MIFENIYFTFPKLKAAPNIYIFLKKIITKTLHEENEMSIG